MIWQMNDQSINQCRQQISTWKFEPEGYYLSSNVNSTTYSSGDIGSVMIANVGMQCLGGNGYINPDLLEPGVSWMGVGDRSFGCWKFLKRHFILSLNVV